ncbi:MAG: AsmA family protein [Candidatus Eisenbacteria bacterium]|nr:AsmA family protein [Candidatus Eisenbacteria bacterium]
MASETASIPRRSRMRVVLMVAAVAILVVVAAGVVFTLVIDPEQYRGRIEEALENATGWEAELGAIDLSLWGGASLDVSPASLQAPGDGSSRFSIEELSVRASLIPLISGTLRIDSLALGEPEIRLVRMTRADGWVLPPLKQDNSAGSGQPASGGAGGMALLMDRLDVHDGRIRLVDRTVTPTRELQLEALDAAGQLSTGTVEGTARLNGGDLSFEGTLPGKVEIHVDGFPTDALAIAPGGDLVLPGGTVSGQIRVDWPGSVEGDLLLRELRMLAGAEPLDEAQATFRVSPSPGEPGGWSLAALQVRAGEAVLTGDGSLSPAMSLRLNVDRAPVGDAVRALRALAPVPVSIEGPGKASVSVEVDAPPDGEMDIRVAGDATAGLLRIGGPLPEVREVEAGFSIRGTERLQIDIERGQVGGGPLNGRVVIEPLVPPGEMRFEGTVTEARFGELMKGFAGDKVRGLEGPTSLETSVRLDLSGEEIDPTALRGSVSAEAVDLALPGWDLEASLRSRLEEKLGSLGALAALLDIGGDVREESGGEGDAAKDKKGQGLLERLVASVELAGEIWKLQPVRIVSGDLSARGSGDFLPGDGTLDLALQARLDPEATKRLVQEHRSLRHLVAEDGGLTLPLTVSGPMTSPSLGFDVSGLVPKEEGKKKIESVIKGFLDK